jgi:hypothetical protein
MSESSKHRHAFEVYWRLGPERSVERLQEGLMGQQGKAPSLRTLFEWSRRYQWQHRIAALERQARVAEDEARLTAIQEMYGRQAREGVYLQQKGIEWLESFEGQVISPETAVRAIVEGSKLERVSRGEPTERQEVKGEVDARLVQISDAELDALIDHVATGMGGSREAPS